MMPFGCFLVRTGERRVLIDAGFGPYEHANMTGGALVGELRNAGLGPEDVTDVVFTHLHFDHVGWATQQGKVFFPNATHRCDARDWEHFMGEEPSRLKLSPLADRIELWDSARTVAPGIDTLPTPGHTPGHAAIVVSSGDERILLLGDVAHCPVEMEESEWDGIADIDPAGARAMREQLFRRLESSGEQAAGAHFPGLAFGRVLRLEGRTRWVF